MSRALPDPSRGALAALHALFFASGAIALVYEVLWMRSFMTVFGATAPATAATLSAMFLGLGAGSFLLGKVSGRSLRPLRTFGLLEAGVGAGALLVEVLLGLCDRSYPALHQALAGRPGAFLALKVVIAAAVLFPPAFFMGGTLPYLAQVVAADGRRLGVLAGGLYAVNTLGATSGALLVPFALLPLLGASGTLAAAVTGSFVVAGAALLLDRRISRAASRVDRIPDRPARKRERAPIPRMVSRPAPRLALAVAFLSGALTLGLETLSTRMFALVHENSVYSFALVIGTFLGGLSIGAAAARVLLTRVPPRVLGGTASLASGLFVIHSPRIFHSLTSGMDYMAPGGGAGLVASLLPVAAILLPASILAGAVLPASMELVSGWGGGPAGPIIGRLLGLNILGAIAGPLIATFILGPWLGLWWSLAATGIGMALLGEGLLGGASLSRRPLIWRLARLVLLVAVVLFARPGSLPRVKFNEARERLIRLDEGSHGTVAVLEDKHDRWIAVNNFYVLGGTASAGEERQQAHAPLLLHPRPRTVAFLGLGTGITAGAALLHPVENVVVLEIVPEVVRAAKDYFAEANHGVVTDPRVKTLSVDAREHLKGAGGSFDVIVGDLFVPWRAGESALYTSEHFEAARRALRPGGLMCQWLPLFQLSEEEFRIVAATFLDVFPRTTLWRGDFLADRPAVALIGTLDDDPLDPSAVEASARNLIPQLDRTNPYLADSAGLWLFLVGPLDPADPAFASVRRNRDAEPWIELSSPWTEARRRGGTGGAFTGRSLESFFEATRARPMQGTPLERLDLERLRWRDAGAQLWSASLLASEGRVDEAREQAFATVASLPEPIQRALRERGLEAGR
ncbi:MAG TPA: fused MFS/spermidine synthase [Planctomycetota bacterium]|nr:fused MFS/spermidine synthase [Planctomycetota bacterium]